MGELVFGSRSEPVLVARATAALREVGLTAERRLEAGCWGSTAPPPLSLCVVREVCAWYVPGCASRVSVSRRVYTNLRPMSIYPSVLQGRGGEAEGRERRERRWGEAEEWGGGGRDGKGGEEGTGGGRGVGGGGRVP